MNKKKEQGARGGSNPLARPFKTIGYGLGRSPLLGLFFLVVEISNENGWFIRSPRSLRVFVQKRIATSDARYKRRLVIIAKNIFFIFFFL